MTDLQPVDILIVEDDPRDAELIRRALQRAKLTNPLHLASDGVEALEFLFSEGRYRERAGSPNPKVVFLDLKLPKVDGLEVLRALRADERTRSIPVVVLTSSREAPDVEEAYRLGVNSYIVKPLDFDKFVDAVGELGFYWLLLNQPAR